MSALPLHLPARGPIDAFDEGLREHRALFDRLETLRADIARVAALMADTLRASRKLMLMGNGGSAADCQHLAAEFTGRFKLERRPLAPGDKVVLIPSHCDTTINLHDVYYGTRGGHVGAVWPNGYSTSRGARTPTRASSGDGSSSAPASTTRSAGGRGILAMASTASAVVGSTTQSTPQRPNIVRSRACVVG